MVGEWLGVLYMSWLWAMICVIGVVVGHVCGRKFEGVCLGGGRRVSGCFRSPEVWVTVVQGV